MDLLNNNKVDSAQPLKVIKGKVEKKMGERKYTEITSNLKFKELRLFYCLYANVKQGKFCFQIGQAT